MRIVQIAILVGLVAYFACGEESNNSEEATESAASEAESESSEGLSLAFGTAGCAAAACHGADGRRDDASLHDPSGDPVTNLSTSERNLASWTDWVRNTAKSPMPRYTEEQYSTADLEADYRHLTGRAE